MFNPKLPPLEPGPGNDPLEQFNTGYNRPQFDFPIPHIPTGPVSNPYRHIENVFLADLSRTFYNLEKNDLYEILGILYSKHPEMVFGMPSLQSTLLFRQNITPRFGASGIFSRIGQSPGGGGQPLGGGGQPPGGNGPRRKGKNIFQTINKKVKNKICGDWDYCGNKQKILKPVEKIEWLAEHVAHFISPRIGGVPKLRAIPTAFSSLGFTAHLATGKVIGGVAVAPALAGIAIATLIVKEGLDYYCDCEGGLVKKFLKWLFD